MTLGRRFGELLPQFLLPAAKAFGDVNFHRDVEVAAYFAIAPGFWQTTAFEPETLAMLSASGNFQPRLCSFHRGHCHLAPEHGLPWLEFDLVDEVVSLDAEIRVLRDLYPQKEIASRPAARTSLTLPRQTDALILMHPGRDAHAVVL